MANDLTLIRALAGSARRLAETAGMTPVEFCEAVIDKLNQNEVANGKVVIATSEAGGSVSFSLPPGMDALSTISLYQRVIDYLANPQRFVRRLRVSFRKAEL